MAKKKANGSTHQSLSNPFSNYKYKRPETILSEKVVIHALIVAINSFISMDERENRMN